MTRDDLNRLRALLAKATTGPWIHDGSGSIRHFASVAWCGAASNWSATSDEECEVIDDAQSARNADLIAAAVNALPALLALAEEALDRREGLVFGPKFGSARRTLAVDGAIYSVVPPIAGTPWLWVFNYGTASGYAATESKAIEAARAHDRARRAKGG